MEPKEESIKCVYLLQVGGRGAGFTEGILL